MSPLAPNCECTVTPGLAFLNAAISAANGVASVPAPNTISVPCAPDAAGLALVDELELLLQAAATVTIRQAASGKPAPAEFAAHDCLLLYHYRTWQSLTGPGPAGAS